MEEQTVDSYRSLFPNGVLKFLSLPFEAFGFSRRLREPRTGSVGTARSSTARLIRSKYTFRHKIVKKRFRFSACDVGVVIVGVVTRRLHNFALLFRLQTGILSAMGIYHRHNHKYLDTPAP